MYMVYRHYKTKSEPTKVPILYWTKNFVSSCRQSIDTMQVCNHQGTSVFDSICPGWVYSSMSRTRSQSTDRHVPRIGFFKLQAWLKINPFNQDKGMKFWVEHTLAFIQVTQWERVALTKYYLWSSSSARDRENADHSTRRLDNSALTLCTSPRT